MLWQWNFVIRLTMKKTQNIFFVSHCLFFFFYWIYVAAYSRYTIMSGYIVFVVLLRSFLPLRTFLCLTLLLLCLIFVVVCLISPSLPWFSFVGIELLLRLSPFWLGVSAKKEYLHLISPKQLFDCVLWSSINKLFTGSYMENGDGEKKSGKGKCERKWSVTSGKGFCCTNSKWFMNAALFPVLALVWIRGVLKCQLLPEFVLLFFKILL